MDSDNSGRKSKMDFSDIMSILDEGGQGHQKEPEREKAATATKPVEGDQGHQKKHEKEKEHHPRKVETPAVTPRDNAFIQKLLSDIEQKNAEILKINSENLSLKYSLSEKDMEIKRLRSHADSLAGQVESLKSTIVTLNQQNEDLNKYINDARAKLGEMDADRAKFTARLISKDEEQAPPEEEEDVASIFKRIALKGDEHAAETGDDSGDSGAGQDKPRHRKKLSTAKLYDL